MGVNAATTTTVVSAVDASDSWAVAARMSFWERELDAARGAQSGFRDPERADRA
jgi:hypothetical protein